MIFLVATVSSAPPVTTIQQFASGYVIEDSPQEYLKQNSQFQYNFFLYNLTDGQLMTNASISCTFYLSNSTGYILVLEDVPFYVSDNHWGTIIAGGNFSNVGDYYYGTRCNSTILGGMMTGTWKVTPNGEEPTTPKTFLYFIGVLFAILMLVMAIFGIFKVENYIGRFALYWTAHLLLVAVSFMLWNGLGNFLTGHPFIIGFFKILWWISITSMFPMLILSVVWIFYTHVFTKEMERLINGGMSPEEAFERTKRRKGGFFKLD
jgi:hypothetical protein